MRLILLCILCASSIGIVSCHDALPPTPTQTSGIETGLVAWYKLDQNTADSSGNRLNGIPQGGSYVPDRFGGAQSAFQLDGKSFISVSDNPALNFDSLVSFSISLWVRTTAKPSHYEGILAKGPINGILPGYAIGLDSNGRIQANISGDRDPVLYSTTSLNNGNWHMVTLTVDAGTLAALYIDGSLQSDFALTNDYPNRNNTAYLFIGKDRMSKYFFTGSVDDIRLYKRSLPPSDIFTLFTLNGWIGDTTNAVDDTSSTNDSGFTANMIENPGFIDSLTITTYLSPSNCPSWNVAYGTPMAGAGLGCDNTFGYLYMWGSLDDGGAVWQPLAKPIKAGHTYHIDFFTESRTSQIDFHNQRYVIVRFLAFNSNPGGKHWLPTPGNVSVIGIVTSVPMDTWNHFVTADWTADADYSNFEIDVSTLASGAGNESWAAIDNVQLLEKQ